MRLRSDVRVTPTTNLCSKKLNAEDAEAPLFPARDRGDYLDTSNVDRITAAIIGSAMKVHSKLGPGLLESAYRACLAYELRKSGLSVECEVPLPIVYDAVEIDVGYRLDMLVESIVVTELKTVRRVFQVHRAQLLSHLRLGGYPVGLLINFHVVRLKHGITRVVNGFGPQ